MEMKLSATSAASSLALLRFLPSYQNLAWWIAPLTVTRLDQAVRPPVLSLGQHICGSFSLSLSPSHIRGDKWLAKTLWAFGGGDVWLPARAYLFCPRRFGTRARRSGTRGMRLWEVVSVLWEVLPWLGG